MTVGYKSTGFQFRLTEVSGNSFDSHTRQNVKKRIENIIYVETPPADAVKLAYVGSKEITPNNNLFLGDRSDTLYENSRVGTVEEFIGSLQPISVNNKNFIVTQQFNQAESGNIPLYYKYEISIDYTSIIQDSFAIFDKNFKPVTQDKFKVVLRMKYDENTGIPTDTPIGYVIYNNLESSFDQSTGEYNVFFIQYTKIDSITGNDVIVTELLNNKIAYREAIFNDLWWVGVSTLKPWVDAYILSDGVSIILPTSGEYAVKYIEKSRLKIDTPIGLNNESPWFLRIVNGAFTSGYDGESFRYHIPEFKNQLFNPLEPYKLAVNTSCLRIDDRLIKLPHEDIQEGALYSYLYLTVSNDNSVEYAITNDPNRDGKEYKNLDGNVVYNKDNEIVRWSSSSLLGIDSYSGIIHVGFNISSEHEIRAVYSYKEDCFEITSLNMNPIFDDSCRNETRALYVVPESSFNNNTGIQTESVRWVKVNPSGKIGDCNQDGSGNNENIREEVHLLDSNAYRLYGVIGLHYNWRASSYITASLEEVLPSESITISSTSSFPRSGWIRFVDTTGVYRYAEYINKTDTTLELSDNVPESSSGIFITGNSTVELVNFIDERTTLSNRSIENEKTYFSGSPISKSRYFILAEVTVNPPHSINEAVLIDVREDGGGINPNKYDEAKTLNAEAQWLQNFGDFRGQLYPGNATIVIKVKADLYDRFTEPDVDKIINENVTLGTMPLVRRFGYEPEIISVLPWRLGFGEDIFGDHHFGE